MLSKGVKPGLKLQFQTWFDSSLFLFNHENCILDILNHYWTQTHNMLCTRVLSTLSWNITAVWKTTRRMTRGAVLKLALKPARPPTRYKGKALAALMTNSGIKAGQKTTLCTLQLAVPSLRVLATHPINFCFRTWDNDFGCCFKSHRNSQFNCQIG
jgi:hypothetical protein